MVVPWQVLTDGNTQIFSFRCYVQFLSMDEVRWWYDLTLGGYAYNFTFIRIEVNLPVTFLQSCKLLRSSWRDIVSSLVLICRYRRQSSANNLAVVFTLLGRSLMYISKTAVIRGLSLGVLQTWRVLDQMPHLLRSPSVYGLLESS
jgi:hypothetical protein